MGIRIHRLMGIFIMAASFLVGWLWMDYTETVDSPLGLQQPATFEIAKGDGLFRVAKALESQRILAKPLWFMVLAYQEGVQKRLKYGEYEISPNMTPRDMLGMFVAGRVRQHPVALVEGWTFGQTLAALSQHPVLVHLAVGRTAEEIMRMVGAEGVHPEGRFFPSTYFVTKGTSDIDVLKRAYQKMQTVLEAEWLGRNEPLPYAAPDEALILASIVEKETASPPERPLVSGVFVRRLQKGMLLQTDPTVIYGLGESYKGDIRKEDLLRDTPYNTYTRSGLPPTPIAMPGLESIRAALHPDNGKSLYFVSRGDGTHVFSTTLEEHQRAVEQFQKR
jgi:UPF0755 protein